MLRLALCISTERNNFDLSPSEFQDGLALCCHIVGKIFTVNPALNCSKGGFVYVQHNAWRVLNFSLLELAELNQVISKQIGFESVDSQKRADRAAWEFLEPQKQALFDFCIFNTESFSF